MEPDSSLFYPVRESDIAGRLRTACTVMQSCIALVERAALARVPVMLVGEPGSGKSLLAGYLHCCSQEADLPVAVLPCGELREGGVRKKLIGENGDASDGLVAMAAGGTPVLDGVEQMTNTVQHELLGILSEFSAPGEAASGPGFAARLGVRLVSLRSTLDRTGAGLLVDELLYGLGEVVIRVPPLRERREDIGALTRLGMSLANAETGNSISEVSGFAREFFLHYDFPGNVRELFSMIKEAVAGTTGESIYVEELGAVASEVEEIQPAAETITPLAEMERRHIYRALMRSGWKRNAAARLLGITETMLNRKIKLYDFERR